MTKKIYICISLMKKIKVPVLNILNTMIPYLLSFSPCFSRCQITKKYQMIITW